MGTPHKWADVLHAIADGKAVQFKGSYGDDWYDVIDMQRDPDPINHFEYDWRIKPEPKPDVVKYLGLGCSEGASARVGNSLSLVDHWTNKIKLTFNGETGALKSAEVLK